MSEPIDLNAKMLEKYGPAVVIPGFQFRLSDEAVAEIEKMERDHKANFAYAMANPHKFMVD